MSAERLRALQTIVERPHSVPLAPTGLLRSAPEESESTSRTPGLVTSAPETAPWVGAVRLRAACCCQTVESPVRNWMGLRAEWSLPPVLKPVPRPIPGPIPSRIPDLARDPLSVRSRKGSAGWSAEQWSRRHRSPAGCPGHAATRDLQTRLPAQPLSRRPDGEVEIFRHPTRRPGRSGFGLTAPRCLSDVALSQIGGHPGHAHQDQRAGHRPAVVGLHRQVALLRERSAPG